ncbi:hypothetical protein C7441_11033 [Pseudaminobacter salicylatoxidans]|uniref:Uncharacterized protein n=1 Tax=Pseudaminobacter salicylatoxidans TaxID=93369 RepID=A0A316C0J6_PSESE|nr:hypothetical protein [Pseudaminobacter salicylatoxidans]PWJ81501.1 hypothetical protein C7441_11033 [Pseudaminobacter salicylatoxidans]
MIALILGSAECVEEDAAAALALFDPDCVIAVNDMIARWPRPIDHAVTLHVENAPQWLEARALNQSDRPTVWSHSGASALGRLSKVADRLLPDWKGSSGLFAVTVARELCMRAVLCGVPMDSRRHVPGKSAATWSGMPWPGREVLNYREGWNKHFDEIAPFVRSMSGWTRELLGEPDEEWLLAE